MFRGNLSFLSPNQVRRPLFQKPRMDNRPGGVVEFSSTRSPPLPQYLDICERNFPSIVVPYPFLQTTPFSRTFFFSLPPDFKPFPSVVLILNVRGDLLSSFRRGNFPPPRISCGCLGFLLPRQTLFFQKSTFSVSPIAKWASVLFPQPSEFP